MTVRILIADDHEVVRQGVRAILASKPEWQVCGEATTGREAVRKTKLLKPTVAILDITLPGLNGLEATRQIVRAVPRTEVLILTMHESEQLSREGLKAGARGYILKTDASRDLLNAIEALLQHKPFFTRKVAQTVLNGYLTAPIESPSEDGLTSREREVIQLVAEGNTNKEVATSLGISTKTAETHRANIIRKLRTHSLSELVRYAIRNKIITE